MGSTLLLAADVDLEVLDFDRLECAVCIGLGNCLIEHGREIGVFRAKCGGDPRPEYLRRAGNFADDAAAARALVDEVLGYQDVDQHVVKPAIAQIDQRLVAGRVQLNLDPLVVLVQVVGERGGAIVRSTNFPLTASKDVSLLFVVAFPTQTRGGT